LRAGTISYISLTACQESFLNNRIQPIGSYKDKLIPAVNSKGKKCKEYDGSNVNIKGCSALYG
jgi:hypothetical protein